MLNNYFKILFLTLIGLQFLSCSTPHNYLSSHQPSKTIKEMVQCVVKYIATNQEINMLQDLNTDEELNSFLVDFWLKRDPTPATEINEYRDEYLERFKVANVFLGGWQSDRGRVFIIYGNPEEVILSADGEIWVYTKKEKIPYYDNSKNLQFEMDSGKIKFYFYDNLGVGVMQQILSTQFGEGR
jgi:GWxTD domain-containing protein